MMHFYDVPYGCILHYCYFFLSAVFILMPVSEETLTNFNKSGIKNVAAVCQFAIPDNRANII